MYYLRIVKNSYMYTSHRSTLIDCLSNRGLVMVIFNTPAGTWCV